MARGRTTSRPARRRDENGPLVVYGANPVRELLASDQPVSRLYLETGSRAEVLAHGARTRGLPVESADRGTLDRLAGSPHHQGAVALAAPFRHASLDRVLGCASALVLDGIQDPRNLGAIL